MGMPGRKYRIGSVYSYGFNGKENDNEIKGEGNQQDYGMRIYDPRLSRFLSVDPLTEEYSELTPYQFSSNSPITFIDRDGEEAAFKMPDGTIYVHPPSDHNRIPIPQHVRDNGVSLVNSKAPPPNAADRIFSVALDFVPYVGVAKMAVEFIFGVDMVTQESSPRMASLPIIKEVRNINKIAKAEQEFEKIARSQKAVTKSEKVAASTENAIVKTQKKVSSSADHHIATNKNKVSPARGGPWTPRFEVFFKKAGLDIDKGSENLVNVLNHQGPHPEAYHQLVFDRLTSATQGLKANTSAYTSAVTNTLQTIGTEAQQIGSSVNKLLTKSQ